MIKKIRRLSFAERVERRAETHARFSFHYRRKIGRETTEENFHEKTFNNLKITAKVSSVAFKREIFRFFHPIFPNFARSPKSKSTFDMEKCRASLYLPTSSAHSSSTCPCAASTSDCPSGRI